MYAPAYGYPAANNPGQFIPNPNAHPNANPNPGHGAPSPSHQQQPQNIHPHLQQAPPGQQQPQHLMYTPQQQQQQQQQQYVGAAAQSPYGAQGQGGPALGGNAGAMGMMQQNNGMAHMPTGPHASPYQTPYSSSPYVGNMPTSTAPGLPPNFMPATSGAPSFPMNASNMNPQHQVQRMQPPHTSSTPTQAGGGPRASPFAGAPHNTPPHSAPTQQQFSTPQAQIQIQSQTPSNAQQAQAGTILTPQTPSFPPGAQGANAASSIATPLSPGSETRERDRVTVLLEINKYLLMEVMRLQAVQAESKKEDAAGHSPDATEKEKADKEKEKAEKAKPASRDFFECMRRLQGNLAYLAAIADRSHKPSSQIPPHPAIMTAPPLSPRSSQPNSTTSGSPKTSPLKKEEPEEYKVEGLEDDHGESLREQYKKLQALFPGVDFKKAEQVAANAARQQAGQQAAMLAKQQGAQGQAQAQGPTGAPTQGLDPNAQQKLQNDHMRQKMMQAQQAQQNAQQQMQRGMQQPMDLYKSEGQG